MTDAAIPSLVVGAAAALGIRLLPLGLRAVKINCKLIDPQYGMRISYFPDPPPRLGGGARTRASSTYRSCSAGYVSLHTSAATSIGLVTEAVLSRANGISLINTTSVAAVVDPEALLLALEQGWVAQAAIEETYPEPSGSVRSADDRVLRLPPYTAWDTEQPREVGWMVYLESRPAPEPRDRGQGADFR